MGPVIDFPAEVDWLSLAIAKVALRLCKALNRDVYITGVEWRFQRLECSPLVWTHDAPIEIDQSADLSPGYCFRQGLP